MTFKGEKWEQDPWLALKDILRKFLSCAWLCGIKR